VKRATIKDLARKAEVSATTVSNALNGKPGVGEAVRQKILNLATEMGYQPNYFARGLVSRQSYALGLTISNISDPYSSELARGAYDKAQELGYTLMLFNTNYDLANETKSLEMLAAKGVDGILLATMLKDDPNIDFLEAVGIPFVLASRLIMNPKKANYIDSVTTDTWGGFYEAAKHLCRLGHTDISMIAGDMEVSTSMSLTDGAMTALKEFGVTISPEWFLDCGYSRERAYHSAGKLIDKGKRPSAFLVQGDNMALGVREAIYEAGLRIPEDMALVGYDDISISALAGVELTTVYQNTYKMGSTGIEMLVDKIAGGRQIDISSKIVLPTKLIVRKTCGFQMKGYVK
jgi:LacI family transcriptional regulator